MTLTVDVIIAIVSSNALTSIITTFINRRTIKIENTGKDDMNWKERISFLNGQITSLEQRIEHLDDLVCFKENCRIRKGIDTQ